MADEISNNDIISRFVDAGFTSGLIVNSMNEALSTLAFHHCVPSIKAEIDQFCCGLQTLGVLDAVRKYKEQFKPFFLVDGDRKLTAGNGNCCFSSSYATLSSYFLHRNYLRPIRLQAVLRGGNNKT